MGGKTPLPHTCLAAVKMTLWAGGVPWPRRVALAVEIWRDIGSEDIGSCVWAYVVSLVHFYYVNVLRCIHICRLLHACLICMPLHTLAHPRLQGHLHLLTHAVLHA